MPTTSVALWQLRRYAPITSTSASARCNQQRFRVTGQHNNSNPCALGCRVALSLSRLEHHERGFGVEAQAQIEKGLGVGFLNGADRDHGRAPARALGNIVLQVTKQFYHELQEPVASNGGPTVSFMRASNP